MSVSETTQFDASLLDDFYSECEEHLTGIRQALASLESQLGKTEVDTSIVERLYRSFHTLKGISGIVGLKEAELLAHGTEDYLRELTRGDARLSDNGLDVLMDAVHKFEKIVAAHRARQAMPDIQAILAELGKLLPEQRPHAQSVPSDEPRPSTDSGSGDFAARLQVARSDGKTIWRCLFKPSAALDARGININEVRARLTHVGEIIQARPQVQAGGISFEFVVALNSIPHDWMQWENDGLVIEPYDKVHAAPAEAVSQELTSPVGEASTPHSPFLAPSHVVRVDLARLDDLMRIAGEMVVHRARFEESIDRVCAQNLSADCTGLVEQSQALGRQLRDLRDAIMRVRLVRVAELFDRMPFVVRDLAREAGKKISITVTGQQTEIDKYVVERLKDPFLHLIRNCVSHAIRTPGERVAAGKTAEATIKLSASTSGDSVVIKIEDDGEGIDPRKIKDRAEQLGLQVPAILDNVTMLDLICTPGFSTREEADRAAGRGVGMAVVAETLRELGGTIAMETSSGNGTAFTMRLPLTLAIADALVVSAGGQTFAVPQGSIHEIVQMQPSEVQRTNFTQLLLHRGVALPLLCVASRFGLKLAQRTTYPIVIVGTERGPVGFIVDRIVSQREVVVRSMRDPLVQVPGVAGATELGDGKPVLIIDPIALVNSAGVGQATLHRN